MPILLFPLPGPPSGTLSASNSPLSAVQAQAEGSPPPQDSPALAAVKELPKASKLPPPGQRFAFVEDPSVRQTSSAVAVMSQLVNLIQLTRQTALANLEAEQAAASDDR